MKNFTHRYFYYPGCSLEGTAKEYDISTRSLMAALEIELTDIPGGGKARIDAQSCGGKGFSV